MERKKHDPLDWGPTDRNPSSVRQQLQVFAEVDVGQHLHYHIHTLTFCGLLEYINTPPNVSATTTVK